VKYYIKLHNGETYEIDELDYNHIKYRITNGRTNGFYKMRGKINPDLNFAFKYFMSIETDRYKNESNKNDIDVKKMKPPKIGKPKTKKPKCDHNWNDPDTWIYVKENVDGKIQYRKQCTKICKGVSQLIKPKEVENIMKESGKTLNDIPNRTILK